MDVGALAAAGVNWLDLDVLSDAGVNWMEMWTSFLMSGSTGWILVY